MKKLLFISFLVVVMFALMGGVALAGGWTTISYTESHDPDSNVAGGAESGTDPYYAIWNPDEAGIDGTRSPHGFFSATSNKCRVCHAVHMAGAGSWRLLRSGDTSSVNGWGPERRGMDRASECNYCHGMSGVTQKRPFRPKEYDVMGEHTIGSTQIPDSTDTDPSDADATTIEDGLSCGSCHTVHGGGDLNSYGNGIQTAADDANTWTNKILRVDPNQDGYDLAEIADGSASLAQMQDSGTNKGWPTLTNFCADCHNVNPNWDVDEADDLLTGASTSTSYRSNPRSHVQGPAADGSLEVYGETDELVANWGTLAAGYGNDSGTSTLEQNTERGCRGCHAADNAGNRDAGVWDATGTVVQGSAWPHQTQGAKLLFDTFAVGTTQTAGDDWFDTNDPDNPNDALRVLPGMDKLCMRCHRSDSGKDTATNDGTIKGVGRSF